MMQFANSLHELVWFYSHPTPIKRPDAIRFGVIVENTDLDLSSSGLSPFPLCFCFSFPSLLFSRRVWHI